MQANRPNPYIQADDGPWMRRYLNWAAPYYDKFPEPQRAQAAALDRWLYSRRSIPAVLAVLAQLTGLLLLMLASGARLGLALVLIAVVVMLCFLAGVRAWLGPEGIEHVSKKPLKGWRRNPWLGMAWILVVGFLASPVGFMVGRATRAPEQVSAWQLWQWFVQALQESAPIALALLGLAMGIVTITQTIRKQRLAAELLRLRLEQERDNHAALASKAQLKVLQAQIKPHFIFNTLAALQHWTDTQDPRASALLQSLTRFLRRSTDSMGEDLVPLAQELELIEAYLQIMQHRMGAQKLQFEVYAPPEFAPLMLPPALLLSLVENAIDHGVAPSLQPARVSVRVRGLHADELPGDAAQQNRVACIDVADSGVGGELPLKEGVGLANSRARLAAHFGQRASLTVLPQTASTGMLARVQLPMSLDLQNLP